jgi:hypothetical protein
MDARRLHLNRQGLLIEFVVHRAEPGLRAKCLKRAYRRDGLFRERASSPEVREGSLDRAGHEGRHDEAGDDDAWEDRS